MLIENDLTGTCIHQSIAGVGININQESFHSPAPNPVSLRQITGEVVDPSFILSRFMNHLRDNYEQLKIGDDKTIHKRYLQSLFRKEGQFWFRDRNGLFKANIENVEPSGKLWVKDEEGKERSYLFKEIEYILTQP